MHYSMLRSHTSTVQQTATGLKLVTQIHHAIGKTFEPSRPVLDSQIKGDPPLFARDHGDRLHSNPPHIL